MKTIKVAVNKSEQRPEGIEIEVVDAENQLEQQTLAYLLSGFVRDAAKRGSFKLELPEQFNVQYQREGSFLLSSGPSGPNVSGSTATYYSPGKPLAVMAIHKLGNRFDVVYGEIRAREQQQTQQTQQTEASPAQQPQPADSEKKQADSEKQAAESNK